MKVDATVKFLGLERRISKNAKPYYVIGILQNMDSMQLFVSEEVANSCADIKTMDNVDVTLNIYDRDGQTQVGCSSVVKLKN